MLCVIGSEVQDICPTEKITSKLWLCTLKDINQFCV